MSKRIITVSREFGSAGRTIAKKVAECLGYTYYDKELVTKIAKESGLAETYVQESGECASARNSFLFSLAMSVAPPIHGGGLSMSDQLYVAQHNIIKEIAEKENCVIVGRCSDYILKDNPECLHVYIHADPEFRARHIVENYGETCDKPEKRLKDADEKRKTYYRHYTGRQWGNANYFDICLDSGVLGIEQCVDIIVNAVKNTK